MSNQEHLLHKWVPTLVGSLPLLGVVATGAVGWANMNSRIEALENTVKTLRPAPTVKEQQCTKLLDALTIEITSTVGMRATELRKLAEDMKCLPAETNG